jgi:hypothetical protein
MDRLRAYLYWGEDESKEWGMQVLALYIDQLDKQYMMKVGQGAETKQEAVEIEKWLDELENNYD